MSALIEYLNENGIDGIEDDLGIRVKNYPNEYLYVFNYSQIDSPKTNPVVREARGSILSRDIGGEWFYVARTFKRFFNYGEAPDTLDDFDFSRCAVMEKADGSLIKVYNWLDFWHIGTRGTAFAEAENYTGNTFSDMVLDCLGLDFDGFQVFCDEKQMDPRNTYIFELTSPENRIVTYYDKPELVFTGSIDNATGEINREYVSDWRRNVRIADEYSIGSIDECVEAAKTLPDLKEGYVVRDKVSGQMVKIKSPMYVAAHHARGNHGLTPKTSRELVVTNEVDEYLKYFPEDADKLKPYVDAWGALNSVIMVDFSMFSGIIDQKEFAMVVKELPYSTVLFRARSTKKDPIKVLHEQPKKYKMGLLEKAMKF